MIFMLKLLKSVILNDNLDAEIDQGMLSKAMLSLCLHFLFFIFFFLHEQSNLKTQTGSIMTGEKVLRDFLFTLRYQYNCVMIFH